jgi:RNA polymerase primary sigma factor
MERHTWHGNCYTHGEDNQGMTNSVLKTDNRKVDDEDILKIYFKQIKIYPLLDSEDEVALSKEAQQGNQKSLHKLINSNLRFVVKIARPYVTKDVPFMDLIQEGNMGLMHAAKKFDHSKNVRFCTYAGWWIRRFIILYMTNKRRMVRLPYRKEEVLRKVQCTYHMLSQTLMRQPKTEEIANELGMAAQDIYLILNMSSGPLPLELGMMNKDNNTTTIEVHEDYTYSPERTLFRQYYREGARSCLDKLKEKERQVISYRYEFDDGKPHTLKEIGRKMALSPETVRQIEMRALAKIRSHAADFRKYEIQEAI